MEKSFPIGIAGAAAVFLLALAAFKIYDNQAQKKEDAIVDTDENEFWA